MTTFILYLAILFPSGEYETYKFSYLESSRECKEITYTIAKAYVDEGMEGRVIYKCARGLGV